MGPSDWDDLFSFLETVAAAQRAIRKAKQAGKEQIATKDKAIERLASREIGVELLVRLGKLAGSTSGPPTTTGRKKPAADS